MKIRSKVITVKHFTLGIASTLSLVTILGIGIYGATNIVNNTNNANALSYSTNEDISFTFKPTLSISLSTNNLTIDNLVPGTTSDSNSVTVTVVSNTPYGYVLSAGVGSTVSTDPYYNTSDLVHDNTTTEVPTTNKFSSISTSANLQTLDTDNTWGYSTSTDGGTSWSTYSGLSHAETKPLLDISDPATPSTIDFKIAARSASTQASGAYNNVITFYAVGKPMPLPSLYDEVAKMSKGTQTLAQLQAAITAPTTTDYTADTSNSGVYEYNSSVFGEASDASNANKIYYYRGVLEPEADQGSYGSDGKATTYPNYVKLGNDTCWRIVRTTGSGGVKMIYNGTWTGSTCANGGTNARTTTIEFASEGISSQSRWYKNVHYVGYTFNNSVTDFTAGKSVDTVFGSDTNPSLNNTRSNIKTYIEDTWYAGNMTAYTNLLEPSAGYCNDRTAYSNSATTTALSTIVPYKTSSASMYFGAYGRNMNATNAGKTPSLTCPRSTVDLYRYVPNSDGVSNELKYPAALLTADELSLAGSGSSTASQGSSYNVKSYLRSGDHFWLLSPNYRASAGDVRGFHLNSVGYLSYSIVNGTTTGVRPAISLKPGTVYASGSGTATDPWIVPAL